MTVSRRFPTKTASMVPLAASVRDMDIHENVVFRNAGGRGIAYFAMGNNRDTANVKSAIQELSTRVVREMGLPLG